MRIVVHDYSGHPFQAQLSRELARRGHTVAHWYCSSYESGKGSLKAVRGDPPSLSFVELTMGAAFDRYSLWRRLRQEAAYGRLLGKRLAAADPDVALLCNIPLLAHAIAMRACGEHDIPAVFWQQDIYSEAIASTARRRLGGVAAWPLTTAADIIEASVARRSSAVIPISEKFLPTLRRWRVRAPVSVIPNWAPLPEIEPRTRDNEWAREHDLVDRKVAMYAGTLGLKHNPRLLLKLAAALHSALPSGLVVVISEGRGRQWLEEHADWRTRKHLLLMDFEPFDAFADVLASADVLIALLEPTAGAYSVPSKILSYLCCGRPVVAAMPRDNDAAVMLGASGGGVVIGPDDDDQAIRIVLELLAADSRRSEMGAAARSYAERMFNVATIANQFESVLLGAANSRSARVRAHHPTES